MSDNMNDDNYEYDDYFNRPPLTVADTIKKLQELVEENPEAANYQVGRYDYDDFSVSYQGFTYGCTEVVVDEIPEEEDFLEGVDSRLTTPFIVQIR